MAYNKTSWRNNSLPAINAGNLNKIEQGIYEAHENIGNMNNLRYGNDLVTAISGIVESASSGNKRYIKFADGTMICTNTIEHKNVAITATWGSFYETATALSLGGDYLMPFISKPDLVITSHGYNFVEKIDDANENNPGNFYACKPKSIASENVKVSYIAIGKWK